jgi:hypothetical protein
MNVVWAGTNASSSNWTEIRVASVALVQVQFPAALDPDGVLNQLLNCQLQVAFAVVEVLVEGESFCRCPPVART